MHASTGTERPTRTGRWMAIASLCLCTAFVTNSAQGAVDASKLRGWGVETYNEIERTLRVPGTALYAETASLNGTRSGGINGRAFVWPASTQFRVLNSMMQIDPAYRAGTRTFSDQLFTAYWNNGYRSGAGAGDRFYDDNAHITVALVEAYRLTGDAVYLGRARATHNFVMSGEDAVAGGGIYFKQNDFSSKDTISTLQAARGAAMLYQATGEANYLTQATRLLSWANSHVQLSNGLYNQGWVIANNAPGGVEIVNSAGIGISTNMELYHATGTNSYLVEARRIAGASMGRYFDGSTGRINDEGYWAYELVDGFANIYAVDGNALWINKLDVAMSYLHNSKRDANGHYDVFWGRNGPITSPLNSWSLNEQASVARAYLYTSIAVPEPTSAMLLLAPAALVRRRRG